MLRNKPQSRLTLAAAVLIAQFLFARNVNIEVLQLKSNLEHCGATDMSQ